MMQLRQQQQTAMALLGYRLWMPRKELALLRQSAAIAEKNSAVSITTAVVDAQIKAPLQVSESEAQVSGTTVLTLPTVNAVLHITRDYLWLCGEKLSCHWLLPPLWGDATHLTIFASEAERRLLLLLFRAINCREALELFTALFDTAQQERLPIPVTPFMLPDDAAQKTILVCGQVLNEQMRSWLEGKNDNKFGNIPLKVYNFLHPFSALHDATLKNTLWRQWVEIKRSLF
ncbi:MAG: hypothetical protein Q4A74_01355 [Cardiobacteriaceae bacterium]|nr:hypothetical protein [Cardiobacteriaceae bacterium]